MLILGGFTAGTVAAAPVPLFKVVAVNVAGAIAPPLGTVVKEKLSGSGFFPLARSSPALLVQAAWLA